MRLRAVLLSLVIALALAWSLAVFSLIVLRWIDPPTTAVHMQRHIQALVHGVPYHERYRFVPLAQISPHLQHAVVAAEDARFYQHHGFDWHEIQIAAEDDLEGSRTRGASTITQQLVKNLFFGTGRSVLRKGAEFTLVPIAELVLGKQRILELYLNIVEWGPCDLRCGRRRALSLPNLRPQSRPRPVRPPRRRTPISSSQTPLAHEPLQHPHSRTHAPDGLVTPPFIASWAAITSASDPSHIQSSL
jgi:monofunctional biosynthetic peptidoglycan transglycosylase